MFLENVILHGPVGGAIKYPPFTGLFGPWHVCDVALVGTQWGETPTLEFMVKMPWPGPRAGEPKWL